MKQFIDKTKRPEDLNERQRKQVLEACDSRYIVPGDKREFCDKIQPEEHL